MILTYMVLRKLLKGPTPAEIEKKRRDLLSKTGRRAPCQIESIEGKVVSYTYVVAGITYGASQDFSDIPLMLPRNKEQVLGPGIVKYDRANAANSIVVCDKWSGLKLRSKALAASASA
jgi:hypothetical protein